MPKKLPLEVEFDRIMDNDRLSMDEKLLALVRAILKHKPKKARGWSALLRRIADYIDTLPEPVELSAKAIAGLIELNGILRTK
jgi:hypothetical protein